MPTGPMQYGTFNSAGVDPTTLYCSPSQSSALILLGDNRGVEGTQSNNYVWPTNLTPYGVRGIATGDNAIGVMGWANRGPYSRAIYGVSYYGYAGYFDGKVQVLGQLFKPGGGFRIDHPGDPENQYLSHAFVESPDMLNVYSGNTITDSNGSATVTLPSYFETLNRDFRYQLTVIGQFAHAIVDNEIEGNVFTIKTDAPNVRVSWQVTGVRRDPWAEQNPIVVEEAKPKDERGTYLHPEAYGMPGERATSYPVRQALEEREREIDELRAHAEAQQKGSESPS